jgi:valyl-tRNA synthetase
VFLHGLIRDAAGAKMSKTRGNTLDPLALIDQYGTDALRFALTTGTAPGNDLRLGEGKLESARNFANKLWNASRFVIASLEGAEGLEGWHGLAAPQHREDRWILSRLDGAVADVNRSLASFELGEAQQRLYDFLWSDFCDWYIEMAKLRIRSGDGPSPLPVLAHVLERTLRLLHPFMPFITEEIWQNLLTRLPSEGGLPASIMVAPYPQSQPGRQDLQAEQEMELVMEAVRAVRNTRAQLRIPQPQVLEAVVEANGLQATIQEEAEVIRSLSRVGPLHIRAGGGDTGQRRGITLVVSPLRQAQGRALVVHLPLEGVVDLAAEEQRLRQELEGCSKNLARVEALVGKADFRAKAKPEVVEREEERLRSLGGQKQRLEEILAQLAG